MNKFKDLKKDIFFLLLELRYWNMQLEKLPENADKTKISGRIANLIPNVPYSMSDIRTQIRPKSLSIEQKEELKIWEEKLNEFIPLYERHSPEKFKEYNNGKLKPLSVMEQKLMQKPAGFLYSKTDYIFY